jgi:hypothetical protein
MGHKKREEKNIYIYIAEIIIFQSPKKPITELVGPVNPNNPKKLRKTQSAMGNRIL